MSGSAASSGLIHFYLAELADTEALGARAGGEAVPIDGFTYGSPPQEISDRIVVTLFTQTGSISTHPVNGVGDANGDNVADAPYLYAVQGEIAGQ